uniref:Uncharacterized protein n=1 Tax=Rhizophora mucronata TaxID=61149 RepID=A0A2P2P259_RHIMU
MKSCINITSQCIEERKIATSVAQPLNYLNQGQKT